MLDSVRTGRNCLAVHRPVCCTVAGTDICRQTSIDADSVGCFILPERMQEHAPEPSVVPSPPSHGQRQSPMNDFTLPLACGNSRRSGSPYESLTRVLRGLQACASGVSVHTAWEAGPMFLLQVIAELHWFDVRSATTENVQLLLHECTVSL